MQVSQRNPIIRKSDYVYLTNIPLRTVVKRFTVRGIRSIAALHSINIPVRWSKGQCQTLLASHECLNTKDLIYVLCPVMEPDVSQVKFLWEGYVPIA